MMSIVKGNKSSQGQIQILHMFNQFNNIILTIIMMDPSINPLDSQMQVLIPKIVNHPYLASEVSKHLRIRINAWISRLQSIISNNIWRKNRNNYLRLLFIMLQCKEIMQPFTSMAPQQLITLQKHQINCILLKLSTRIKQRQREKENRQSKLCKANPTQLWNSLDTQCKNSKNIINKPNTKSVYQNQNGYKNSYLQSIGIDLMSPISQIAHMRAQSNLSECTYSSLEKVRDMLTPKQKILITDHIQALKQKNTNVVKKQPFGQDGVKYFKKNRDIKQEEKLFKSQMLDKKSFFQKLFYFLKRNEENLQEDVEYNEVMCSLKSVLNNSQSLSVKKSIDSVKTFEKSKIKNYNEELQQNEDKLSSQNFSSLDQNSFDYKSGNYSEYSSIQMDEGIQNFKIQDSSTEECFRKKIFCESLCNKVQQVISPSCKTPITKKVNKI